MSGVPGPVSRFVVLFFTPMYLILLASILSSVSEQSFPVLIVAVFAGAAVMVTIIAVLSDRFYESGNRQSKFSISTLMFLTVACSIYMAYISPFVSRIRHRDIEFYGVTEFLVFLVAFVVITTIVLIRFTEALIAVAVGIKRLFKR